MSNEIRPARITLNRSSSPVLQRGDMPVAGVRANSEHVRLIVHLDRDAAPAHAAVSVDGKSELTAEVLSLESGAVEIVLRDAGGAYVDPAVIEPLTLLLTLEQGIFRFDSEPRGPGFDRSRML